MAGPSQTGADDDWGALVAASGRLAASLPDILIAANHAAASVAHGLHGRRRAGPGETFWQFRRFLDGEPAHRVDWRRSARDDHLYVREKEWESAHTVWLWPDVSPSMAFRSRLSDTAKRDRGLVLAFALTRLLVEGGERVGLLGLTRPSASRNTVMRFAETLSRLPEAGLGSLPPEEPVARFAEFVVISDLLEPFETLSARLRAIAANGARGHLVMVLDPIEETFPFDGRMEFVESEAGGRFLAGRAETYRAAYLERLAAHRGALKALCMRLGWSFVLHHTDRPAHEPLLLLNALLTADTLPGGGPSERSGEAA